MADSSFILLLHCIGFADTIKNDMDDPHGCVFHKVTCDTDKFSLPEIKGCLREIPVFEPYILYSRDHTGALSRLSSDIEAMNLVHGIESGFVLHIYVEIPGVLQAGVCKEVILEARRAFLEDGDDYFDYEAAGRLADDYVSSKNTKSGSSADQPIATLFNKSKRKKSLPRKRAVLAQTCAVEVRPIAVGHVPTDFPSSSVKRYEYDECNIPDDSVPITIADFPEGDQHYTDYEDSDDLRSIGDDCDRQYQIEPFKDFVAERDMGKVEMSVGMKFTDSAEFKAVLRRDAITKGYSYTFVKNESSRTTCQCKKKDEGCSWRIHASWAPNKSSYQIKSYESQHKCARVFSNERCSAEWLAAEYERRLRENPKWDVKSLQSTIQFEWNLDISLRQLYKVRSIVRRKIEGDQQQQYWKLWNYTSILLERNPGSVVKMSVEKHSPDGPPVFKRLFVMFAAVARGFKEGCRPFIGLDGCHLTLQEGILLSAIARDANNEMFPLAICVAEGETKDAWIWFLDCLKQGIGDAYDNANDLTFMSDRQKGLVQAIENVFPRAEHRCCARHMYANMSLTVRGKHIRRVFHSIAKAYTRTDCQVQMERLRAIDEKAFNWVRGQNAASFCRAYFGTSSKCDLVTNNMCEAWNGSIMEARDMPIITMMEKLRRKLMERLELKRRWIDKQAGSICPKPLKKLQAEIERARNMCRAIYGGGDSYEVIEEGTKTYIVNLATSTCDCRKWNLTGIPCCHACAACSIARRKPEDLIHHYFTKEYYKRTYQYIINPIPDASNWPQVGIDPPVAPFHRTKPGRPKKRRTKSIGEERVDPLRRQVGTLKCTKCLQEGHNKRTCTNAEINRPLRSRFATGGKPGRPKKNNPTEPPSSSSTRASRVSRGGSTSRSSSAQHASWTSMYPSN